MNVDDIINSLERSEKIEPFYMNGSVVFRWFKFTQGFDKAWEVLGGQVHRPYGGTILGGM